MNAYVCVYRQPTMEMIKDDGWEQTRKEAYSKSSPRRRRLKKYLQTYEGAFYGEEEGRFYDWGDDPSFFCAEELLGDVRKACWGVCRPDVRYNLRKGDFVVFFCAQQQRDCPNVWHYYYIGVGTIGEVVPNHKAIWQKKKYKRYRKFYNLLIDSYGHNRETIYPHHDDKGKKSKYRWQELAKSPYIIFDSSEHKTHFNLVNPLFVATYNEDWDSTEADELEDWEFDEGYVDRLYHLIPSREGGKKLRGSPLKRNAHRHMNLSKELKYDIRKIKNRRKALLKISREIAAQ